MKKIHLLLLLLAAMLASCSSDSFKIDGTLVSLDGPAVRVVLMTDSGMVDESVDVDKKGKFSFKGQSEQPAIVSLMGNRGDAFATVVVANGDHLKMKGDVSKPLGVKVKGNRLNEEWHP